MSFYDFIQNKKIQDYYKAIIRNGELKIFFAKNQGKFQKIYQDFFKDFYESSNIKYQYKDSLLVQKNINKILSSKKLLKDLENRIINNF